MRVWDVLTENCLHSFPADATAMVRAMVLFWLLALYWSFERFLACCMMFLSLMLIAHPASPEHRAEFAMQAFHPEWNLLMTGGRKGVLYTYHLAETSVDTAENSPTLVAKRQKTETQDSRRQVCHRSCLLLHGTKTPKSYCKPFLGVNKLVFSQAPDCGAPCRCWEWTVRQGT